MPERGRKEDVVPDLECNHDRRGRRGLIIAGNPDLFHFIPCRVSNGCERLVRKSPCVVDVEWLIAAIANLSDHGPVVKPCVVLILVQSDSELSKHLCVDRGQLGGERP